MESLESELERAREVDVTAVADAIEAVGFECTRCGACCKGADADPGNGDTDEEHTATVFPDEVRDLQAATDYDWRDVARPTPFGLEGESGEGADRGETFEWALQTNACGDCAFYEEFDGDERGDGDSDDAESTDDESPPDGRCTVYGDRPLVCRTYPFSLALGGTDQPMGGVVEREGLVQAHECEGLGRDIDRADAEDLARTLKERAVRELEEAIAVRDNYEPADPGPGEVVVHDSEGAKRPDGTPIESPR